MDNIVLLNLRVSMWGVSRVLPDQQYEVDADKALVRASKKILECPEYEFLMQLKRRMHAVLHAVALPGSILRAGIYPIALDLVEHVEAQLANFEIRWGVGVEALGSVWDLRVREVSERLGALYNEDDYPSWERVQRSFGVAWSYFTMTTPQSLGQISSTLLKREKAKAVVEWKNMLDEIRDGLRFAFKEVLDAFVDKLTPAPDGTKKRLVGTDRLITFLNDFSKQNVADDTELKLLIDEARALMSGVDVETLRKDKGLRDAVQERMQGIQTVLDLLVQEAPTRQIVLRD